MQRNHLTSEWVAIYRSASRGRCADFALTLSSVGIPNQVELQGGESRLLVAPELAARALHQIFLYGEENRRAAPPAPPSRRSVHAFAWLGVALYCLLIAGIGDLALVSAVGHDWYGAGNVSAHALRDDGQWWRLATALTLHRDVAHLLGNALFGGVFGLLAARVVGGGFGWLAILLAGMIGNLIAAALSPLGLPAIGASTAVFGALGLLGGWAWPQSQSQSQSRPVRGTAFRRWAPLVACVCLLVFTAGGADDPRVDVVAHLAGFVIGGALGVGLAALPRRWLWSSALQSGAGAAALLLVSISWLLTFA